MALVGGCIVKKAMGMLMLLILFVFLLAACDDSEKTVTNHESDRTAEQHENKEKEKTPEAEENEELSKESTKPIEVAYKVTENWSIVPIDDANEEVVLITIDVAP